MCIRERKRIVSVLFLKDKELIIKKQNDDNNVSGFVKSPRLRKVASFAIINPPFFNPIKPIKRPTPEPMAIRRFKGMLSNIHRLNGVTLIITNKTPAKKTVDIEIIRIFFNDLLETFEKRSYTVACKTIVTQNNAGLFGEVSYIGYLWVI